MIIYLSLGAGSSPTGVGAMFDLV